MCGIFAIVPKTEFLSPEHLIAFRALMVANEKRGHHSWGCCWQDAKGKTWLVKDTGEPSRGGLRAIQVNLANHKIKMAVGHTRHATHGAVTADNAHPFSVAGLRHSCTLVHNGVVKTDGRPVDAVTPVDSWALARAIADLGEVDAISLTSGSAGLIYLLDGHLRVYRGNQMLAMVETPDAWMVSSDKKDLEALLRILGQIDLKAEDLPTEVILAPWDSQWTATAAPLRGYVGRSWDSFGTTNSTGTAGRVGATTSQPATTKPDVSIPARGTSASKPVWDERRLILEPDASDECGICARKVTNRPEANPKFRATKVGFRLGPGSNFVRARKGTQTIIRNKEMICAACLTSECDPILWDLRADIEEGVVTRLVAAGPGQTRTAENTLSVIRTGNYPALTEVQPLAPDFFNKGVCKAGDIAAMDTSEFEELVTVLEGSFLPEEFDGSMADPFREEEGGRAAGGPANIAKFRSA